MTTTMTYTGTLVITSCHCGIRLAIPDTLYIKAQADASVHIYCPIGHTFVYRKNEAERQRERAEAAEQRSGRILAELDQERARTQAARNQTRAYKGALTKTKKRAVAGVCPAPGCKRSFQNVARHVKSQHPELCHEATS